MLDTGLDYTRAGKIDICQVVTVESKLISIQDARLAPGVLLSLPDI
jgi:hypothetical protein